MLRMLNPTETYAVYKMYVNKSLASFVSPPDHRLSHSKVSCISKNYESDNRIYIIYYILYII